MDSDNTWTAVGKGGRAVTFPSDAAAAFGGKSFNRGPRVAPRSEFPADAAAAFGRKPRGGATAEKSWMGVPDTAEPYVSKSSKGVPEFDSAAAAAFGGKSARRSATGATTQGRTDFPEAFGKKKSTFTTAAGLDMGGDATDGYRLSAFARKRAEAAELAARPPEPKKQTYDEMFPSFGKAAPPIVPKTATSGKPTLADIMRKRVEEEAKEEAKKATLERARAERERIEAVEAMRLRTLRVARMGNYVSYSSQFDDNESEEVYTPGDLDYDAYGVKRKELTLPEPCEDASDSSSEGDNAAEDDEY